MILTSALPVIAFDDDIVETRRMFPDAFEIRCVMLKMPFASQRFEKEALVGTAFASFLGLLPFTAVVLEHMKRVWSDEIEDFHPLIDKSSGTKIR